MISEKDFGLRVSEQNGDEGGVVADVECAEESSGHGNSEVQLHHSWNVWSQHRNHIAGGDAELGERGGDSDAAVTGLAPRVGDRTVDYGSSVGVDDGGSVEEADGSERNVVGRRLDCSLHFLFFLFLLLLSIFVCRKVESSEQWWLSIINEVKGSYQLSYRNRSSCIQFDIKLVNDWRYQKCGET